MYETKLREIQTGIDQARGAQGMGIILFWTALALFALLIYGAVQRKTPLWAAILPLPAIAASGRWYVANQRRWSRLLRLRTFCERGVARIEERWQGNGFSGEEFRREDHVYDADLNVLGTGSLFELLCTARTGIGRRRLAEYLLDPCSSDEALERQESVRELKPLAELRERVALLGNYSFQESTWDVFAEWTHFPAELAPSWIRAIALVLSVTLAALALAVFITNVPAARLLPLMPPPLAILLSIAWYFRKQTERLNGAAARVGVEIAVAREGIELISTLKLHSVKLREIQQRLGKDSAASSLLQLERLTNAIAECDKPYFDLPSRALIVRTQLCFAIEAWKHRHARHLRNWLDGWAEFEALSALACYAHEHPDDPFPEFHGGGPEFAAQGLGHPLIPVTACVRNDVALGAANRFYIVSGSNMAGKSTLLRSVGLNAVLAKAGAPVRACTLRLTDLELFASLSIVDSLAEGRSKFLAEVDRMRRTLEAARVSPVLFLVDEILSGTNSRDRRIASESIVKALLDCGAIGVLSTHDLALTEIADLEGMAGSNVHMGSRSDSDPMDFDYLLKPGVTTETNALAIVSMIGVDR